MQSICSSPARWMLACLVWWPAVVYGQGSLTPTGAPAPTMKTLDQVEARIIVNAANCPPSSSAAFVINKSGSYYLPGNIVVASGDGIAITATGVTLDLNGFTISSTSATAGNSGIYCASAQGLTLRHGLIKGTTINPSGNTFAGGGFSLGIYVQSGSGVRIEEVTVTGIGGDGIDVRANETVVSHCVVDTATGYGIFVDPQFTDTTYLYSTVDHCSALRCGNTAIQAGVVDACSGSTVGTVSGANGIYSLTVSNSSGTTFNGFGVYGITASNCIGNATSGFGVAGTTLTNCYGNATSGYGIGGTNSVNCDGNSDSGVGVGGTTVTNCEGSSNSNVGISAACATGCFARTSGSGANAIGLDCRTGSATNCYAQGGGAGSYSLRANIATGCTVFNSGGTAAITNKYLMP